MVEVAIVSIQATTIVMQGVPSRTTIRSTTPPEPARRLIVQRTIAVRPTQDWKITRDIGSTTRIYITDGVYLF